jgi:EmrB/QacA subfamily drug resistance transporter
VPSTVTGMAKWWTLVAVCIATFMLLLDITVVNVALPYIERDLGSSFEDLQWVIDAYTLTLAAFLLIAGSVADRIGRRRVFLVGLAVFTVASALCGLANTPLVLNLARGLQGVGGSMMFATSLALLASAYAGRDRGTAIGIWGATIGGAVAVGPLIGGVLVEAIGWEAIFYVNVPIGAYAIYLTMRRVQESRDPQAGGADWLGTVTFSGGLFLLVFALIRGNSEDWNGTIIACLAASALLLVAFVVVERRIASPMLDLTLFRKPSFGGASIAAFVLSGAMFAMFLYLTLWVQNILGYSALEAGLRFMPITLVSFFVAPISGKFSETIGVRWLLAGGLTAVGIGLLLMHGIKPGDDWTVLLAGFLVAGAGIGLTNPALATAAIGVVEPRRSGMASGINSTFRQVGVATGIALWGAIFQHVVSSQFLEEAARARLKPPPGVSGSVADFVSFGGAQKTGNGTLIRVAETSFDAGLNHILLIAAVVALVGAALCALLVRPADFVAHAPAAAPAAAEA